MSKEPDEQIPDHLMPAMGGLAQFGRDPGTIGWKETPGGKFKLGDKVKKLPKGRKILTIVLIPELYKGEFVICSDAKGKRESIYTTDLTRAT